VTGGVAPSGSLPIMADYDFLLALREELNQIVREAGAPGVDDAVRAFAAASGVSEQHAFAAFWRASKRHGESLEAFAGEVRDQHQRQLAATGGQ
jgi:hypothetical protein